MKLLECNVLYESLLKLLEFLILKIQVAFLPVAVTIHVTFLMWVSFLRDTESNASTCEAGFLTRREDTIRFNRNLHYIMTELALLNVS